MTADHGDGAMLWLCVDVDVLSPDVNDQCVRWIGRMRNVTGGWEMRVSGETGWDGTVLWDWDGDRRD
jgi:hypothetical protein